MQHIINRIREKPPEKRNQIVWICAGIAVGLLLIIWVIVGNGHHGTNGNEGNFFQSFNQGFQDSKNLLPNPLK